MQHNESRRKIGSIQGAKAPTLIKRQLLKQMKQGAVVVDVCIDQGGCFETSRPTTHHEPTYIVDGVVHYCVTNMPGAVGRTSSHALCNSTLPYRREIAKPGIDHFATFSPGRAAALNIKGGKIANAAVVVVFPDLPHV